MKTNRARWIACLLACAIGVSLTACGKDKKDSSSKNVSDSVAAGEESSEGTIASEDLAKMQKQDMTFSYAIDADDESSGNADVPVNKGVTSQNGGSSGEDSYVVVTDDSGQAVKDDSGNVVTEVVKGGNNSGSGNENSTAAGGNSSSSNGNNGNSNSGSSYQADMKTFQAYWLDMSNGDNVVCNGDFLDVTFKIKDDAPDGNYALTAGENDFANWDAESVPVAFVDGDVAVGSAAEQSAGSAESGTFTIAAGTAKGNPGDEVTVRFDMSDNPGIVALIFRFKYDANALEVVNASVGSDCKDYIKMAVS